MNATQKVAFGIVCALSLSLQATLADDGGISFGGSPHLLNGHCSVQMKSELVTMDVGEKLIKVDCKFVFHNEGPACTVRMGFPDQGVGAEEPYQGEEVPKTGLKATFQTYESWVDGKKVATRLVPTNDRSLYWHAKTVHFKANSDSVIRDVYTLLPGAQVTSDNGLYQQTYYVLHTGASWRGPIGKGEVVVSFAPDVVHAPIDVKPLKSVGSDPRLLKWATLPPNIVLYEGPSVPKIAGTTLRFTFTNLKPTTKDDIHLYYGWHKLTNM